MLKSVGVSIVCGSDVLQHIVSTKVSVSVLAKDTSVFERSILDKGTKRKHSLAGLNHSNDETSDSSESSSEDDLNVFDDEYLHRSSLYMPSNTGNSKAKPTGCRGHKEKEKEENGTKVYFDGHGKVTSDHRLSRISGQMNYEEFTSACSKAVYSHAKELSTLKMEYEQLFSNWMYLLSKGINLLLFGVGSKYRLLDRFLLIAAKDYTHIVINGYFPGLTVKSILSAITEDVIGCNDNFQSVTEQCEFIRKCFGLGGVKDIILILHNIDGPALQSRKMQMVLSMIACIPGVHIVASADHVNGSLLWDQGTLSQFSWVYFDVTTYDFYSNETSFENSMLIQETVVLQLSSLLHVLCSLTQNAQSIFRILASYQLDNCGSSAYTGLSFPDLYQKCRESFLVSSDLTLHAQLTEFHDHKLIRIKKGLDGIEYLTIPLEESALAEFLQQHEET